MRAAEWVTVLFMASVVCMGMIVFVWSKLPVFDLLQIFQLEGLLK